MKKICEYCGSDKKVTYYNKYSGYLCHKHYMQYYHTNKLKKHFRKEKNEILLFKNYAEIILYNNNNEEQCRALIDLDDVDKCKNIKWSLTANGYVATMNNNYICLHNYISKNSNGNINDHINGNKLDNRKSNLRSSTYSQNNMNSKISSSNTSGMKGISFSKRDRLWHSYINLNKQRINLGYFKNLEDAISSRMQAEKKYFGEYSVYKRDNEVV